MPSVKYLITGGVGFIGSSMVRNLVANPKNDILIVDKLTYSANLLNVKSLLQKKKLQIKCY